MTPQQSCEASNTKKIACVSPHPIPLPSGERGRVRGQIAVRKNVKLPFRLRRHCFHPHSRAVGYSTAFFINHSDAKGLVAFLADDEVVKNTDLTTQSTIHDSEKFIVHLKKGSKR
jgi:hypothetical protein